MPTIAERGLNLYEAAGLTPESSRMNRRRIEGQRYLERSLPAYSITSHRTDVVSRYNGEWPRHILRTAEKGTWHLIIIDPKSKLTRPQSRVWHPVPKLAEQFDELQDFLPPSPTPRREDFESEYGFHKAFEAFLERQNHTDVQMFLKANWNRLARQALTDNPEPNYPGELPCNLEVNFANRRRHGLPDVVGILPDTRPHLIEIGKNGKFGVVGDYVGHYLDRYPMSENHLLWSVIHYDVTDNYYELELYTDNIPKGYRLAA